MVYSSLNQIMTITTTNYTFSDNLMQLTKFLDFILMIANSLLTAFSKKSWTSELFSHSYLVKVVKN